MAQGIGIGLALALSAAALTGCKKAQQETPAPAAAAPAPAGQTQAEMEAASQAAYEAEADPKPTEPVAAWLWRADHCSYLGAEIGGDRSEHDVQVQKKMDELKCGDELIADGQALKAANASDADAVAKIDAALKAYIE